MRVHCSNRPFVPVQSACDPIVERAIGCFTWHCLEKEGIWFAMPCSTVTPQAEEKPCDARCGQQEGADSRGVRTIRGPNSAGRLLDMSKRCPVAKAVIDSHS